MIRLVIDVRIGRSFRVSRFVCRGRRSSFQFRTRNETRPVLVRVVVARVVVANAAVRRHAQRRASPPHGVRVRHAHERPRPQRRERDAVARRRPHARVRQQKRHAPPVAAAGDAHAQTRGVLGKHVRVQRRDSVAALARRARASAGRADSVVARRSAHRRARRSALALTRVHRRDRRRRGRGGDAHLAAVALALEQARRAQVRDDDAPARLFFRCGVPVPARRRDALAAHRRAEERAPTRQGVAGEHQPPAPRTAGRTTGRIRKI